MKIETSSASGAAMRILAGLFLLMIILHPALGYCSDQETYGRHVISANGSFLNTLPVVLSPSGLAMDRTSFCEFNPSSGVIRQLAVVERQLDSPLSCNISDYSYSPSGKYIYYIQSCSSNESDGESVLYILDSRGKVLHYFIGVFRTEWNKRFDQLAFLTGKSHEGYPGFSPSGFVIYDLESGSIFKKTGVFYDIYWARHDGNLYFADFSPSVKMYNPSMKKLLATTHKGIYFSPGGRYYFSGAYEETSLLFRTREDKEITGQFANRVGNQPFIQFCMWVNSETAIIDISQNKFVINVRTGQKSDPFTGAIRGVNSQKTKLLINPLVNPLVNSIYALDQLRILDIPKIH